MFEWTRVPRTAPTRVALEGSGAVPSDIAPSCSFDFFVRAARLFLARFVCGRVGATSTVSWALVLSPESWKLAAAF